MSTASGWLEPLPPAARAEIENKWPELPIDAIERAFGYYLMARHALPSARAALREEIATHLSNMRKVRQTGEQLRRDLMLQALLRLYGRDEGHSNVWETNIEASAIVEAGLKRIAARHLSGRTQPRAALANELGRILAEAGMPVDARPKKGALCPILDILLRAAREEPSSVVAIARMVVRRRRRAEK
jgi:hypothetical protein